MVSFSIDAPPNANRPSAAGRLMKWVALAVALSAVAGGGFWVGRATAPRGQGGEAKAEAAPAPEPSATGAAAPAPDPTAAPAATASPTAAATPPAVPAPEPAPGPSPTSTRRLVVAVSGALEESIASALPPEDRPAAEQLTQVVNRLLVWDLRVSRDGRKGDLLEVLWTPAAPFAPGVPVSSEPVVDAVRYASQKLGTRFAVYRFQPDGARWARYHRPDGTELEERLVDGPIGEYDQITSLLRDGRRHKGVDFRTPVGTPVFAPFDGVVQRRNWNFGANGNCLDLRDPATGRHAVFIHLDVVPPEMRVGRRVRKGEQIAFSGNSGRSYAPHLHYQLEAADGRILDPFEVHRTEKVMVPAAQRALFEVARARLDAALDGAPAATQVAENPAIPAGSAGQPPAAR